MTGAPLDPTSSTPAGTEVQIHRLCVLELALDCGHIATVAVDGWYPVWVACCDRLGGTVLRGIYVPYASEIDYVDVMSERYETRPARTPRDPSRVLGRRSRTDEPHQPVHCGPTASAGRFPTRVGAAWHITPVPPADHA